MLRVGRTTIAPICTALALLISAIGGCSDDAAGANGDSSTVDAGASGDLNPDFTIGDGVDDTGDAIEDGTTGEDAAPDRDPNSTLGVTCMTERECNEGELCVGADARFGVEGYCTFLDCVDSSECEFGDGQTYCCSDFGPQARGCFREAEGAVCGDNLGEHGASCETGGQSDCEGQSHFCVDFYNDAYCAQFCRPGARPNQPGSCPDDNWCLETGGGNGICVPHGDQDIGESCNEDPFQCGEGQVCDGAFQDPPTPGAFCATLCGGDGDCDDDEWCRIFPGQGQGTCLPAGEGEVGDSCAVDRFSCGEGMLCLNEGTRYANCADLCQRERDCERGTYCAFFGDDIGACLPEGERETGDECADNPLDCAPQAFCIGGWGPGYNPDAYCSDNCEDDDAICRDGFYCADVGDSFHCLPDGEADVRDECEASTDCPEGTACIYLNRERDGRCQPFCEDHDDCEDDEWCTGDACLPAGSAEVGSDCGDDPWACPTGSFCGGGNPEYCIATCNEDPSICINGTTCVGPDDEGNSWCALFGDGALAEDCEGHDCAEGLFCAFNGDDGGICTNGCNSDNDCTADYWCLHAAGGSACVPTGDGDQGDGCDTDRFSCGDHALCFYAQTDEAFCAQECTGFADSCPDDTRCEFIGLHAFFCMPVGETTAGGDCSDDPQSCDDETLCLNPEEGDAFCATTCTFDGDRCGDEEECHFFPNGLGLCVPPGFEGDAPL